MILYLILFFFSKSCCDPGFNFVEITDFKQHLQTRHQINLDIKRRFDEEGEGAADAQAAAAAAARPASTKARTVSAAGRELYGHVTQLAERIVKVGRSLDGTVRDYNATLDTLEQGVLPSTRKLSNLGIPAHPSKLPAISQARVKEVVQPPSTDEESVNTPG